jgi:hypothetical protein
MYTFRFNVLVQETSMLAVDVLVQPFASVPVTVYTVVAEGVAFTTAPLAGDNELVGLYV